MCIRDSDGRFGFGGACFPKDTSALINYADSLDVDLSLIKDAIKQNNKIRSTYKKQTEREKEQNISFKDYKESE